MKSHHFSVYSITCLLPIVVFLLTSINTTSASESYRVERWKVAGAPTYDEGQYVSANGLPQISVKAIVKDEDGFVWLGTENGLARFDGRKFEFFNTINTPALGSNWIHDLFLDNTGRLWIVTGIGLVSFYDGKFEVVNASFGDEKIRQVITDNKSKVWVVTDSIWSFQGDEAKSFDYAKNTITHSYYDEQDLTCSNRFTQPVKG